MLFRHLISSWMGLHACFSRFAWTEAFTSFTCQQGKPKCGSHDWLALVTLTLSSHLRGRLVDGKHVKRQSSVYASSGC